MRVLFVCLAAVACGHARPLLQHEPLVTAGLYRQVMLQVGNETVPFILDTGGHFASLPLAVAQRQHFSIRDHSKLDSTAQSRFFFVDYYGGMHADLVAYSTPVTFPGGESMRLDLQLVSEGAYAQVGTISPQDLLNRGDAFILDRSSDELQVLGSAEAVAQFRGEHPDAQQVEFMSCGELRAAAVEINGVKTWLQLSTASTATFLNRRSPVLATMLHETGKVTQIGGLGPGLPGLMLGRMPVHLAGRSIDADVVVVPSVSECKDVEGSLGMDVLQNCSIAWTNDALWVSCGPQEILDRAGL